MKKILFTLLILLININKVFASENPFVQLTGDIAWEVFIMVLKIWIPLSVILWTIYYYKHKK